MWVSVEMTPWDCTEVIIGHTGKAESEQKMCLVGPLEGNEWKVLSLARRRTVQLVFALARNDPWQTAEANTQSTRCSWWPTEGAEGGLWWYSQLLMLSPPNAGCMSQTIPKAVPRLACHALATNLGRTQLPSGLVNMWIWLGGTEVP